jgi:hypothetical protein
VGGRADATAEAGGQAGNHRRVALCDDYAPAWLVLISSAVVVRRTCQRGGPSADMHAHSRIADLGCDTGERGHWWLVTEEWDAPRRVLGANAVVSRRLRISTDPKRGLPEVDRDGIRACGMGHLRRRCTGRRCHALTGLLFVAVSVKGTALWESQALRSGAAQRLVLFMTPVMIAVVVVAPNHRQLSAGNCWRWQSCPLPLCSSWTGVPVTPASLA